MAKNDNLSDFMTDIADAIRAKKGTSEPINAQDFSSEIANIETGGGGGSMEYWSVPEKWQAEVDDFGAFIFCVKVNRGSSIDITSSTVLGTTDLPVLAIGIDRSFRAVSNGQSFTIDEFFQLMGTSLDALGFTPIDEEEFYKID